jgi:hypothetical protein
MGSSKKFQTFNFWNNNKINRGQILGIETTRLGKF